MNFSKPLNMKQTLILTLLVSTGVHAQVFMRPAGNAAQLGMGGIAVSLPDTDQGAPNDAVPVLSRGIRVLASSAVPYGITDWQCSEARLIACISPTSAASIRLWHNSTGGYTEQSLSIGYGRKLSEKMLLGISADGLRRAAETCQPDHLISCTVGVISQVLPRLRLGCAVQNPLPRRSAGLLLPSVFRTGATWQPGPAMFISAETEKTAGKRASVKTGMEYRPLPRFALRAGVRTGGGARLCFGAGVTLKNGLTFDAATEWRADLGITPAFMISRTFAPTDQINSKHS